jgi:hypothetical protein
MFAKKFQGYEFSEIGHSRLKTAKISLLALPSASSTVRQETNN